MKRSCVVFMLAMVSSSAAAEWTPIGTVEARGGIDVYVDRATLKKSGHTATVSVMEDHKTAQKLTTGDSFSSAKFQYEYDCKDRQRRTLNVVLHSGRKGGGAAVHTNSKPFPWRPISADTVGEAVWKIACGKK